MGDKRRAVIRHGDEEVELVPGATVSIGRHEQNDLVIDDASVSRFHVTLRWDKSRPFPYLCDNGSQNGTFVDGRQPWGTIVPIQEQTELRLGDATVTVALEAVDAAAILHDTKELVALFTEDGPNLRGSFKSGADLRKLLYLLEVEQRTGTLELRIDRKYTKGRVTYCLGRIMAVELGAAQRTRALEKILLLDEPGRYQFSTDLEPTGEPLDLWFSDYIRARSKLPPTQGMKNPNSVRVRTRGRAS